MTDEGVGRATVATLNAPGIHVVRRDKRGREFDDGWGDGWDLVSKPSAKLRMVRDMISQRGIAMMAVTETRLRGEEMQAVRGHMRRAGLDHTGTPGRVDENSGHAVWGVSLIWAAYWATTGLMLVCLNWGLGPAGWQCRLAREPDARAPPPGTQYSRMS